jgi:hypothetical protein
MSEARNLYLRKGVWYARVQVHGVEKRHSLRTDDFAEALRRLSKFVREARTYRAVKGRRQRVENLPRVVYFIGGEDGPVKIGVANSPQRRLAEIQAANARPVHLLAVAPGGFRQEKEYHRMFADGRLHCEWFERSPELVAEIARLSK